MIGFVILRESDQAGPDDANSGSWQENLGGLPGERLDARSIASSGEKHLTISTTSFKKIELLFKSSFPLFQDLCALCSGPCAELSFFVLNSIFSVLR